MRGYPVERDPQIDNQVLNCRREEGESWHIRIDDPSGIYDDAIDVPEEYGLFAILWIRPFNHHNVVAIQLCSLPFMPRISLNFDFRLIVFTRRDDLFGVS
ncbi:hypothetical protein TARUN_6327 [Trichoderma arundinaceum]|uniref:Uncharacterized protein n=1 Tax=Trichoderma arundinaceum TaxID=490622 RepID=A0A395NJ28_TRIAR|nr:hypothetical protein TARUN_6327 [Trichoderma arundinaceum]